MTESVAEDATKHSSLKLMADAVKKIGIMMNPLEYIDALKEAPKKFTKVMYVPRKALEFLEKPWLVMLEVSLQEKR